MHARLGWQTDWLCTASDVLVWFGFQTMVLVWFQLVLFQNPQTKTKTMESGLVWFGFGFNHGFAWAIRDHYRNIMNIT
jgi:hypothetical protein